MLAALEIVKIITIKAIERVTSVKTIDRVTSFKAIDRVTTFESIDIYWTPTNTCASHLGSEGHQGGSVIQILGLSLEDDSHLP